MQIEQLKQGRSCPLTDGLYISLIRQEDLDDILTMLENPNVTEYLFFAPAPVEVYQGYFDPIIKNTHESLLKGEWPESPALIVRDDCGRFMGMAAVDQVALLPGNYEVGYQLPEHAWNKGIATFCCKFLTELAFNELGAHKICADCYSQNVGSFRVLEKTGYVREGLQKEYYCTPDGKVDRLLYGITKSQYLS